MTDKASIYRIISDAIVDGELPEGFSLPRDDDGLRWADGAQDGVALYHMGRPQPGEAALAQLGQAVRTASAGDLPAAMDLFADLSRTARALPLIDPLQAMLWEHRFELNDRNLRAFGSFAIVSAEDTETVKFGLAILEVFRPESVAEAREAIRTLGLSDEFTLFVIFHMLKWEDGNREVWELAKRVHGWGRIHAVERLAPETPEIREWLLTDGVHNGIGAAYSALTCWEKGGASEALRGPLTRETFSGIRDIIEGLLDEGPVRGISAMEEPDAEIAAFLNAALAFAREGKLLAGDYETVDAIRGSYEDNVPDRPEIISVCEGLLQTSACRAAVAGAVREGRCIALALSLGLDCKEDFFRVTQADFSKQIYLIQLLMHDPSYQDRMIALCREKLPLEEMKAPPTDQSLNTGLEMWKMNALEIALQALRDRPGEGLDFVETALQCAPVRLRNMGLAVLEAWTAARGEPLSALLPQTHRLLAALRVIEPNEGVRGRMDKLIAGTVEEKR